jgi:riboflavin kinase/FMN adenylyltransferase
MEIFPSIKEFGESQKRNPVVLSIGMFDGVHLGHQSVLEETTKVAREMKAIPVAFTFPEHPGSFLRPGKQPPLIMASQTKAEMLLRCGMRAVIMQRFDHELANVEANDFILFLQKFIPSLVGIGVGQNFRFGKKRVGDSQYLLNSGKLKGVQVHIIDSKISGMKPVSSSRIRVALTEGKIGEVNKMLGSPYQIKGVVKPGKAMGRTIGFPTLNVDWNPEAKPAYGVYAGTVSTDGNELYAVANYGLRPTLESEALIPKLEIHALDSLDPETWKAGIEISMQLLDFIRPEMKFESLELLREQITKDKHTAEALREVD